MGTTTTNYNLYKPDVGETGWGASRNSSIDVVDTTMKTNEDNITTNTAAIALNTTHRTSDGTDHANVVLNDTHRASDGTDHANVVLNDTHRASDGTDHANVVLNDTHRASDGTDHSAVVLNNTHRTGDGSDHADVATNSAHVGTTHDYAFITGNDGATDVTAAELEELTDGSVTALHSHAGGGITLQTAFDAGQTITIADTDNQTLAITNNDTTNDPETVTITNAGTNHALNITQSGDLAGGDYGLYVYSNTAQSASNLVRIHSDNASSNQAVAAIINDGTGQAQYIGQVGNGTAVEIDNDGTGHGLYIHQDGALASSKAGINLYSAATHGAGSYLLNVTDDDPSSNAGHTTAFIRGDSAGKVMQIQHNTTVLATNQHVLYIENTTADIAADAATVKIVQSSGSATEPVLEIANSGSGADIEKASGNLTLNDPNAGPLTLSELATSGISFIIDGGGSAITTGIKGDLEIPFDCTIQQATLLLDQSATFTLDIWKDTYANFPPTVADTITAAAKPSTSAATKDQDSTLTGWTTSVSAGDIIRFNVDANDNATRATISLKVIKT